MKSSGLLKLENGLTFVLVLVLTTAEPLPSTENLCTRIQNYTVTEREQYQEPVMVTTATWCSEFPFRCVRNRIEMRTQFRIKSEVKQRNITDCCEGFAKQKYKIDNYYTEKCIPLSNCSAGLIGDKCDIECPKGTWGISCQQTCSCGAKGLCSWINGTCRCLPGWKGSNCTDKCSPGKWGHDCSVACSCINGFCHHETGVCTSTNTTSEIHQLFVTENNERHKTSVTPAETTKSQVNGINSPGDNYNLILDKSELKLAGSEISTEMTSKLELPAINSVITTTNKGTPTTSSNAFASTTGSGTVTKVDTSTSTSDSTSTSIYISTSTTRPILAVLHVPRKPNSNQIITSSIGTGLHNSLEADKIPVHVPMSLDIIAFIVIGSIISLGLTIMAALAILHVRAKLYETLRVSIYDTEKFPGDHNTNSNTFSARTRTISPIPPTPTPKFPTLTREKGADVHTISRNSHILTPVRDYEIPRCIIPERPGTLPKPNSITRESTCSNQYLNIHLCSDLRDLLEAHYDRPPSNPFQLSFQTNTEGEHLYDEIPLQTTTFSSKPESPN
ncbi:uncharacterized protein LOC141523892 isoform X1 [Cotesia typhae]|uniref:uncharacterized protein LOC141523892 isoform X1 n=2 Tax=Cotesia typhae TaxID=2053667 RepID=UPI003D693AEA